MALLSKTESSSFNSFLDHALDSMDYEVSREWAMYSQHPDPEQYHDKNALTKATKDLMALDARGYAQQQQQQYYYPQHPQQHHQQLPTMRTMIITPVQSTPGSRRSHFAPAAPTAAAAASPYHELSAPASVHRNPINSIYLFVVVHIPPDLPPSPVVRRPSPKHTQSAPAAPSPPTKRPRTAPPPVKPALLSPSQKKANHIQSEQKRRANIRRGYEALCDVVPALRDAIREEEALSAGKRGRGRGRQDESGEKVDGRAGPRSENVVLSKSIDYMNDLLADRDALRARLDRARSVLPPGHPARTPLYADPLWEREWKGGVGHADEEAEDEDDDSS
ncbi:hypothetical protein B0H14DRAFT_2747186 [Mycena olivaceomarginata]|nr:hypothetical protein B0H14DRAFT_2747186 [Mycena olivaceomarginata]